MFQRLRVLMALLAVSVAMPPTHAQPMRLEPANTTLILSPRAERSELEAASMLQTWLRKAARSQDGFEIQVLEHGTRTAERAAGESGTPSGNKVYLLVGKTFADDDPWLKPLNDDGFLIHREGRNIIIAGRTADGTYYGAVEFLSRFAGVRFYMPTDLWTSLPEKPEIAYDDRDVVSQPFVVSCSISGMTNTFGDDDWLRRIGGARRKGGTHQHNLFAIFPPEKFADAHPEIYPIYKGQRYIPKTGADQTWQIDFTEPATLAAAEQSITEYFAANPRAAYIAVSVNDGGRWSESPHNQEIIAAFKAKNPQSDYLTAATSDIYWHFMNELGAWMQQTLPGKLLVGLAYGPTREPPDFKLADNVVVFANFHIAELSADRYMEPVNGQPPLLTQWLDVSKHFGNHDWYEGGGYVLPRDYTGYWQRFMQALQARLPDAFIHCEAYPNWGMDGPKYYLAAKIWWDPQTDTQAILRQFCDDMFGPAAPAMNGYFTELETLWIQLDNTDGPERKLDGWGNQFATTPASRAMIARCREFLNQAAAAAVTNEQKARIALFSKCFSFSESLFDLAADPTDEARFNRATALAEEIAKDPWALYHPETAQAAVGAIYKGPLPAAPPH